MHEEAPGAISCTVFLKNEGRTEALFTLYFLALLVQALIEREPRLATQRAKLVPLPRYTEQRRCKHPTTEQIRRLFSLAERHTLRSTGCTIQVFHTDLTDLQRQLLSLRGVSAQAFQSKDPLRN